MFQYPQYEDDGSELLSEQNIWRDNRPQPIVGADCFTPFVDLQDVGNIITLELSAAQFREMFSALYNGAEITYPDRYLQIIVNFLKGVHCPPEVENEEGCLNFYPSASFVEFTPQDPYNEPDYIPDDLLAPPFFVNSGFEYPSEFGYLATDVFIDPASINIDPIDLLTLNLPTIKISVFGSGQIELDLLAVSLGSQVIIKIGSPPNLADIIIDGFTEDVTIIDLNTDSLSVPPETDIVYTEEINIEAAAGERTDVYLVFVPNLDDSFVPLRYGGGIRNIGLCGFEQEGLTGVEDLRFNTENCTFEKRVLGVWEAIEGGDEWLSCVEALMATQEEVKQAIIEGGLELASRMIAGEGGNTIAPTIINKDGTWEKGSAGVDVDDPATELDEGAMSIMGAAIHISKALEVMYDKIDQYYGATNNTALIDEATMNLYMRLYFPFDENALSSAISAYYAYRVANNRLLWDTSETQQNVLYCQGTNLQGWNKWFIDYSGFPAAKINVMSLLSDALLPEFWDSYFEAGAKLPSTQYLDAPCVPIPPQTLEGFTFDVARATSIVKANHRMKIRVEGYATDADGDIQDWFWYREEPSGVNTWTPATFVHSAGNNLPSQTEVPYSSSHVYEYTIDLANLANNPITIDVNKHANFNAVGMVQNVPFKITLTDLGQHTII